MNRNPRIQTLAEAALAVALAAVLNLLALRLPINIAGGSISLTMLPIAIVALRRGPLAGAAAGTLFGLLDLLMEPFILVPAQVILDYPLPYLVFGLAVGLLMPAYQTRTAQGRGATPQATGAVPPVRSSATPQGVPDAVPLGSSVAAPGPDATPQAPGAAVIPPVRTSRPALASALVIIAFLVGGILRYACHVFSGVLFFSEYAGSQNVWLYSIIYNISYLAPSLAASLIVALIILPILQRAVPPQRPRSRRPQPAASASLTRSK